jgi:K+:H+ antiporter
MTDDTMLIATVVAAFVLALALGYVAVRLRIPPLVGYLIAGIGLGPFTPGIVADANFAAQLAEIGVILLMFGVGLHFSFKDLLATRRIALPGALVQMTVATTIGAGLAALWGWSLGAGLVFGLSLSVASSVVLLRALEQLNALDSAEGHIAMGWLIAGCGRRASCPRLVDYNSRWLSSALHSRSCASAQSANQDGGTRTSRGGDWRSET